MTGFGKHWKLYIESFFLGMLIALAAFGIFIAMDHGLFMLSDDFNAQEQVFGTFMNRSIKSGDVFFNWGIDIGSDFISSFSFYNLGSPFFLMTLPLPGGGFPYLIGWMFVLKYGVAACTASMWLRQYTKTDGAALLGAVLYAFSGYQAVNIIFYHFHDMVAFFPLLLLGLDHLMKTGKISGFAAAVALNALSNWNFFIQEVIWLILYYVIRYQLSDSIVRAFKEKTFGPVRRHLPWIGRCFAGGILGTLIASVLFIPSIHSMLGNTRANTHIPAKYALVFETEAYLQLLKGLLFPGEPMDYQLSMETVNWYSVSLWLPMVGILLVLVFLFSGNGEKWLKQLLMTCGVFTLVPFLNNSFMLFTSEPYRRWFFMLLLMMSLASALVCERIRESEEMQKRLQWLGKKLGMIAVVLILYLVIFPWDFSQKQAVNDPVWFAIYCAVGILGILLTVLWGTKWVGKTFALRGMIALAALFGWLNLIGNIVLYRTQCEWNSAHEMYDEMFRTTWDLPQDTIPFRYSIFDPYYNRQMSHSMTSNDSFISTVDNGIFEFYKALELGRHTVTPEGPLGTNELLSVRWYLTDKKWNNGHNEVPFVRNNGTREIYMYENWAALPIGFAYDSYITSAEYAKIPKDGRAAIMLRTLVVKTEDVDKVSGILEHYDLKKAPKYTHAELVKDMDKRRKECSQNFMHDSQAFLCDISTKAPRYVFFSVPYSDYWHAYVNGRGTEILDINGLMAVPVARGESQILFEYDTSLHRHSAMLSILGLVIWVLLAAVEVIRVRKHACVGFIPEQVDMVAEHMNGESIDDGSEETVDHHSMLQ